MRALLAAGPGSWGPASGGAEWMPVLSLSSEEQRLGSPLWAVYANGTSLFCTEIGPDGLEPKPPKIVEDLMSTTTAAAAIVANKASENTVVAEAAAAALALAANSGSEPMPKLREIPWKMPVGRLPAHSTKNVQDLLLAHHLAKYAGQVGSCGLLKRDELGTSRMAQSTALGVFKQLMGAGELERALDVARGFIMDGGPASSMLCAFAKDLRLRAHMAEYHRLADEVVILCQACAPSASKAPVARAGGEEALAASTRSSTPAIRPLFEPGEFDAEKGNALVEDKSGRPANSDPPHIPNPPPAATPRFAAAVAALAASTASVGAKAPVSSVPAAGAPSPIESQPVPAPAPPTIPVSRRTVNEGGAPAIDVGPGKSGTPGATVPKTDPAASPSAVTSSTNQVQPVNPFAKRLRGAAGAASGGAKGRTVGAARHPAPPATPMSREGGSGEPPLKAVKIA